MSGASGAGEEAQRRLAQALASRRAGEAAAEERIRRGHEQYIAARRENTRSIIAVALIALVATVSIGLIACVCFGNMTIVDARDLAGVVLAPLVVLTGTVFGFYYSGHKDG